MTRQLNLDKQRKEKKYREEKSVTRKEKKKNKKYDKKNKYYLVREKQNRKNIFKLKLFIN